MVYFFNLFVKIVICLVYFNVLRLRDLVNERGLYVC